MEKNQKRFVLVHGLCHGAWTWYKVKTQLEAAGHCVIAVDLAASDINMTRLEEIQTLKDYSKPLLEFLSSLCSDDEKDLVLAKMLVREDLVTPEDDQRWMIRNFATKVIEIKDADHMAMLSKPPELCVLLLKIADKYA
ncbi:hypothetical protein EUTSA_v10000698mg [Eutrema salsugineum]|uniref:AB hydrolase-1 domain-containing protein n=1 Tax=Eutrema salsugineum TaxID=72664 RepID=V4NJ42_EUTSA|nr:hypothetical protein EUTSA_v10000698mg [Eutrema salsugineum]